MKNNTPRRKRLNKTARLSHAKDWIRSYQGKNLVRGYSKWFGVDMLCAVNELKLSGVSFASESEQEIIRSFHQKIENKRKQKQLKDLKINGPTLELLDSDENFAFIVGRASNGAPYGVT